MSEAVIDGPSNLAGHVLLSGLCGLVATYQGVVVFLAEAVGAQS